MKKIIFSILILGGLTSCGGHIKAQENRSGTTVYCTSLEDSQGRVHKIALLTTPFREGVAAIDLDANTYK